MYKRLHVFDLSDERGVLRTSIATTLFIALLGIGFGLFSGSASIIFDGAYSTIDVFMSLLSLLAVNLIVADRSSTGLSRKWKDRFSMGFWHLEPIILGVNGALLIGAALYALVTAVTSLLDGGRVLQFGWAIVYASVTFVVCVAIATLAWRANRRIGSEFVALDVKAWIMSAGITASLLLAFVLGYLLQGTQWDWVTPYIDPAVLALVCLVIIPIPVATVRNALAEILLMTPLDLKEEIDEVATAFVARHGFLGHRAYVARVGRSKVVELYFIVPADAPPQPIGYWDALREEIGHTIGDKGPDRWLSILFTADRGWTE